MRNLVGPPGHPGCALTYPPQRRSAMLMNVPSARYMIATVDIAPMNRSWNFQNSRKRQTGAFKSSGSIPKVKRETAIAVSRADPTAVGMHPASGQLLLGPLG